VRPWVAAMLAPLFRYSYWRNAYVLRLIGERVGPVLCVTRRGGRFPPNGSRRRAGDAENAERLRLLA